jgi:5-methylthioadenosine/S-adenosylhomocysteine deaminase
MRKFLIVVAVIVISGCSSAAPDRRQADLIISNGTVLTMAGTPIPNGSVAIRDGEIAAVGTAREIDAQFHSRRIIDASGMAVLPGFVNAHTHAAMALFRGIADDRDLMDWLQNFIFPAEAKNVDRDFVKWGTRLALAEMIRSGTTTYADMYYFESDVAEETFRAGVRGVLGETLIDFPAPDNKSWSDAIRYSREFARRWKNNALITPALAPHAPFTVSREHLIEVRGLADELQIPILIHVSETKDELRQVAERAGGLTPAAYLDSIGFLKSDVLAAHGVWLTESEIGTLASRGVGVAHCPESNMMLASGVAPLAALLAAGVDVGLGTDGPAGSNNNLDMIEEMASAARLQKVTSENSRAISARQVLEMATIGGARALGLADRIGTLEPGKRADLIVVDLRSPKTQPIYSPESAVVYAASGADVYATIVDGRILMLDDELLTIDEKETTRMAQSYRERIIRSLEKK